MLKVVRELANALRSYIYIYIYIACAILTSILVASSLNSVYADTSQSIDYQVNIASSLNLEVTSGGVATNNVTLNLDPNIKTFDSSTINVKVATNNVMGYNLSMTTSDGTTNLTRNQDPGNTGTPDGIAATMSTLAPNVSGYSESTFSNCNIADCLNKWGFKVSASDTNPSKVTTNYFPFAQDPNLSSNYHSTNGDNTSLTFAAKIDYNQKAGTYENTLVFNAVATYATYTINYYDGVDNTAGNEIATQEVVNNTQSTIALNPTYISGTGPTRSGLSGDTYTFTGWCDELPGGETTEGYFKATSCPSGHQHPAGGIINVDPAQTTDIDLYAYWDPTTFAEAYTAAGATSTMSATPTSGSARTSYIMQNMTSNICHNVTVGEYELLGDNRSGNYGYYVAKLKDDKCWMVQNLRLGTNTTSVTLTNANSNITANSWTLNGKVDQMPFTHMTDDVTGDTNVSGYDGTAYNCSPVSNNSYVGCYYNWYTATAGTGTSSVTGINTDGVGVDVNSSICPKGWVLPKGGPTGDFESLRISYPTVEDMLVSPETAYDNSEGIYRPGFILSGRFDSAGWNSNWSRYGTVGYYYSRTAYSSGYAYQMTISISTSTINTSFYGLGKYDGKPVRCLAYGS